MKSQHNKSITLYFISVFAFAWTIWIATGFLAPQYFLAETLIGAWSPTLIALYFIARREGKQGLKTFLKKIFKWKVNIRWYLIVLFSIPAIAFVSLGIYKILGGEIPPITYPQNIPHTIPLAVLIPILFISGIFFGGPLAEDIGWRGYAVPELHKKIPALKAAVIVGVIWVIWHLPFFWFKEGAVVIGYVPLFWFAILTIGWAILFAWVYFNTKSLIMPVLYHSSINTTLGLFGVLNNKPSEPNTTLLLINSILTWLFIAWVVRRYGSKELVRKNKSAQQKNINLLNAA